MIHEVVAFYNDDINELKKEFKDEFNEITKAGSLGWYTFYFSSYNDYTIRTEFVHCYLYEDTALFFVNPCSMLLLLNNDLQVDGGDINSNGDIFLRMFWNDEESSDIVFLDDICTRRGAFYGVFSFKYEKALNAAKNHFASGLLDIEHLELDEDDLTEISLDYLDERISKFEKQIDRSLELEEPIDGMDENPFQNDFYDVDVTGRKRRTGPIESSIRIGDKNV